VHEHPLPLFVDGSCPNKVEGKTATTQGRSRGKLFQWAIVAAALVLIAVLFSTRVRTFESWDFQVVDFLFWTALLAVVELLPVSLGFGTQVTMAFPIYFAIAIIFPPWAAMAIAGIGAFDIREIRRTVPLHRALFNRAQNMISVGATAMIFAAFHGQTLYHLWGIVIVGVAAVVRFAANIGLVSGAVALDQGVAFRKALRGLLPEPVEGFAVSYVLLTGLGVAAAFAYRLTYGELTIVAFFVPLILARLSLLGARAQQELSERVRKQQEALLAASEKVFEERENERKRIAEDIHDSSLQMLAAAAYGCGNATDFLAAGYHAQAREAITSAHQAIDGAMKGLRESLVHLRRSSVEEGGLLETIRKYVDQVSTVWGTDVAIEGRVQHEPPIPVALAAFQILQEGLVNAMKHAQNSNVTVRIGDKDGMVHIVVQDSGPGFDPEAEVGADHVGMRLMKERAARVGGRIELDAKRGSGTRLEAILPGGVAQ
jgi:signal transduction histidine kinase